MERQERPRTTQRKTWVSGHVSLLYENMYFFLLINKVVLHSPLRALFVTCYQ